MISSLFTIGFVSHSREAYENYLLPSIVNLEEKCEVISISSQVSRPAHIYNRILSICETPFLILAHEDVSFSPDLFERIQETIKAVPDFGALCMVGGSPSGILWSTPGAIHEVDTSDSCFLVVRKENGFFDSATFDEYHLYVEDYCARLKSEGKNTYTINLGENSILVHGELTFKQQGACWGNYYFYRRIFMERWPTFQTT
jgi:hypothetical protein